VNYDDAFLHWLAGFVAGDGCFVIRCDTRQDGYDTYSCQLRFVQRDDDLPILRTMQQRLGMGNIYFKPGQNNDKPQCQWVVSRIDHVRELVSIFDEHPLRSRRQGHYEIWKEAVMEIYNSNPAKGKRSTYDKPKLIALRDELQRAKQYSGRRDT